MSFHRLRNPIIFDHSIDSIIIERVIDEIQNLGVQYYEKITILRHIDCITS